MAEYQKFVFSENYSTEAENLRLLQQKKLAEAKSLMADEMERLKKEAFELGFQEGQKQALEKLKSEMDLHTNKIIENITQINNFKPELHKIYEEYAVTCVRHAAKNMFFKSEELFTDKLLEQSVNNALQNLPFVSKLTLKVPQDCKIYLEDTGIEDKIKNQGITDFRILEDVSLKSGECLLEWDNSGVLSSKQESLIKINNTFDAFLNGEDTALSDEVLINRDEYKAKAESNDDNLGNNVTFENSEEVVLEANNSVEEDIQELSEEQNIEEETSK